MNCPVDNPVNRITDRIMDRIMDRTVIQPTQQLKHVVQTVTQRIVRIGVAIAFVLSLSLWSGSSAWAGTAQPSTAPDGAYAYIIQPQDGAAVPSNFLVQFGLSGMGIAPSGVDIKNTGHHHLLIDMQQLPDLTQPLASTEHIQHFGAGQTETQLSLAPGEHTLQLILGNYAHIPHDKPVISEPITVTVE